MTREFKGPPGEAFSVEWEIECFERHSDALVGTTVLKNADVSQFRPLWELPSHHPMADGYPVNAEIAAALTKLFDLKLDFNFEKYEYFLGSTRLD